MQATERHVTRAGGWLAAWLIGCSGCAYSESLSLALQPATSAQIEQVLAAARDIGIRNGVVFAEHSASLARDGQPVGLLVSGRGLFKDAFRENANCFLAVVRVAGKVELIRTIGAGEWEAESCLALRAIGVVRRAGATAQPRIGLVYQASSPNAVVIEPVVLVWDPKAAALKLDDAASKQASLAGATTLRDISRAMP